MMIIDYLGHSEVLINIKNSNNENVQILSDAWLSSYSVADLMQRNPIIKLDYENFAPDAVFISHAHMDHFDPYSLIKIFKYHKPVLLLPETLTYLKDILTQYLDCEIKILKNKQTISFK
jgi:L-ascorbate metabolism protein UlaG (beta-lactamase superfamily)